MLYYKSSGVSFELHQVRNVLSKTLSLRSSPVPSPSNKSLRRIISSANRIIIHYIKLYLKYPSITNFKLTVTHDFYAEKLLTFLYQNSSARSYTVALGSVPFNKYKKFIKP